MNPCTNMTLRAYSLLHVFRCVLAVTLHASAMEDLVPDAVASRSLLQTTACSSGNTLIYTLDGPDFPLTNGLLLPGQCGETCMPDIAFSMGLEGPVIVGKCADEGCTEFTRFESMTVARFQLQVTMHYHTRVPFRSD